MFLGPAVEMLQCERYTQIFSERVPKVVISVNAMMTILWCQCQEIVSVREELKKEALREGLVAGVGSGREQNERVLHRKGRWVFPKIGVPPNHPFK